MHGYDPFFSAIAALRRGAPSLRNARPIRMPFTARRSAPPLPAFPLGSDMPFYVHILPRSSCPGHEGKPAQESTQKTC